MDRKPQFDPVLNTHAESVPSFGVMAGAGVIDTDTGQLKVAKPTVDEQIVWVNDGISIAPNQPGNGTQDNEVIVAYDKTADGDPAAGVQLGVKAGSWLLRKNLSGFVTTSPGKNGLVNAIRTVTASQIKVLGPPDCSPFYDYVASRCLRIKLLSVTFKNTGSGWVGSPTVVINGNTWRLSWAWGVGNCCPILTVTKVSGSGSVIITIPGFCTRGSAGQPVMSFTSNDPFLTGVSKPACGTYGYNFLVECGVCPNPYYTTPGWYCIDGDHCAFLAEDPGDEVDVYYGPFATALDCSCTVDLSCCPGFPRRLCITWDAAPHAGCDAGFAAEVATYQGKKYFIRFDGGSLGYKYIDPAGSGLVITMTPCNGPDGSGHYFATMQVGTPFCNYQSSLPAGLSSIIDMTACAASLPWTGYVGQAAAGSIGICGRIVSTNPNNIIGFTVTLTCPGLIGHGTPSTGTKVELPVLREPCKYLGSVSNPCACGNSVANDEHFCNHPTDDREFCTRDNRASKLQKCSDCTSYKPARIVIDQGAGGIGDGILGLAAVAGLRAENPDMEIVYNVGETAIDFVKLFEGPDQVGQNIENHVDTPTPGATQMNIGYRAIEERGEGLSPRWVRFCENIGANNAMLPKLHAPHVLRALGEEYKGRVLLFPFSSEPRREWDIAKWIDLETYLQASGYETTVLSPVGMEKRTSGFVGPVALGLQPGRILGAILNSLAVICNDSGPAHLSGIIGVPTLVISGHMPVERIYGFYPFVRYVEHQAKLYAVANRFEELALKEVIVKNRSLLDWQRLRTIRDAVVSTRKLPGALAELGVFRGGVAKLMATFDKESPIYLFDTFEGIPEDDAANGKHKAGEFAASLKYVQAYLSDVRNALGWEYIVGRFPESAYGFRSTRYKVVHVDGDTLQTTEAACEFFGSRMVPGGVIVFDDYGWTDTPGIKPTVDKWFGDRVQQTADFQAIVRF